MFGVLLFSRVHNFQEIAVFSKVMVGNIIIFETSIISWKLCGCFEITTPMLLYLNPILLTPLLTSSYLLGFVEDMHKLEHALWCWMNPLICHECLSQNSTHNGLNWIDSFLHFLATKTLNISYLCFSSLFHSFPQPHYSQLHVIFELAYWDQITDEYFLWRILQKNYLE